MKYGTNASHEQRIQLDRRIAAGQQGWSAAWRGDANPYRSGTAEYQAFNDGAERAAFDARRVWP